MLVIPHEMLLLDTSEALDRLYHFMGSPPKPDVFRRERGYSSALAGSRAMNRYVHGPQNPLGYSEPAILQRDNDATLSISVLASARGGIPTISLNWFLTNVVDAYFRGSDELLSEDERASILENFSSTVPTQS